MKDKIKACCETCDRYSNGSCVLRRVHKYPWDCCARYQINVGMRTIDEIKADIAAALETEFLYTATYGIKRDRLQEICEAERDGRLVVLPCKVGDILELRVMGTVQKYRFMGIIQQKGYLPSLYGRQLFGKFQDVPIAMVESFGKTVFLTREEAEAKLKELEEKSCTRD